MAELIKLDFSSGIKANKINNNFDTVERWIKNERKRLGGRGLVEGFDLSCDLEDFTVKVGKGVFINEDGEEKEIPEKIFYADEPSYIEVQENIICPDSGIIELSAQPYSPSELKYIRYVPPMVGTVPKSTELLVEMKGTDSNGFDNTRQLAISQVTENKVYIRNAAAYKDKELTVTYKKAGDRIDSITLGQSGIYHYEKSIDSVSPSHVQLKDYSDGFFIGAVYWQISDQGLSVSFYTNHRTYRTVYVDNDNMLWLNGEPYKRNKEIYFVKPENPQKDDMWYDEETNDLYVYRKKNGVIGWVSINDHSTMTVRSQYMFKPGIEFPGDKQTFTFPEDRMDLHFVPNQNALEIIIDNAPLMQDQYSEIVLNDSGKSYLSQGRGFKLNDPLDRETFVQVIVNHQVKSEPLRETFQRAAIFVNENFITHSFANIDQIYKADEYYTAGEDQLEVFVNGVRLDRNEDFIEMRNEKEECTKEDLKQKNIETKYFKVKKHLEEGDRVSYKISKHVWNYDQLSLLMGTTLTDISEIANKVDENKTNIEAINKNMVTTINSLRDEIDKVKKLIPDHSKYMEKNDIVAMEQLDDGVKEKLISEPMVTYSMSTMNMKPLNGLSTEDFVQLFYISADETRILIKNVDYTLIPDSGGITIELQPELINKSATIYINAIRLGAA